MFFSKKVKNKIIKEIKDWVKLELKVQTQDMKDHVRDKIEQNSENEKQANLLAIPANVEDYVLHGFNDKKVRKKHAEKIKEIYKNRCAICGHKRDKDLTMDHYFIPRSHGGMLVMKERNTKAIYSNCVLLCEKCNGEKAALSVNEFVTDKKQRKDIAVLNSKLTDYFRKVMVK